jgi:beta-phosphoglucomutase
MNIKACIFDLDGVIVDTAKYHYIAWREIASEFNIDFTEKNNELLKGVSRMCSLEILLGLGGVNLGESEKELLAEKKNKIYRDYILKMTPDEILPGVLDFIDEVRRKGIKTGIGSASKNTMTILNKLKIDHLFDAVVDGNKVTKAKPNPEIFLKCAEELKVAPANCIVFEDAEAGTEAALAAGMKCVGIGSPEILWRANIIVNGFKDFSLKLLKKRINSSLFLFFM